MGRESHLNFKLSKIMRTRRNKRNKKIQRIKMSRANKTCFKLMTINRSNKAPLYKSLKNLIKPTNYSLRTTKSNHQQIYQPLKPKQNKTKNKISNLSNYHNKTKSNLSKAKINSQNNRMKKLNKRINLLNKKAKRMKMINKNLNLQPEI